MSKLRELVKELNDKLSRGIIQEYCIDELFYCDLGLDFDLFKIDVVFESRIDEHRWYGLQDIVFRISLDTANIFVMTTVVTQIYSEDMSISDVNHIIPELKIVIPNVVSTTIYVDED